MPTTLGPPYAPDFEGIPTHMSTEDLSIWRRFHRTLPPDIDALYFDVNLGAGAPLTGDTATNYAAMWYRLTSKRADVIAHSPRGWDLIELRANAQPNAIGRLLTYQLLWREDPPTPEPLTLWLITDHEDRDVRATCNVYNILYRVV